jgi:regulator of RNase E activity RraA
MRPAADAPAEIRAKRLAYYEYIASAPGPTIAVLQDIDHSPGFGAFWGEVNTAVHKGLGCLGGITNGSIRDLDAAAEGFQLLAGKVCPSHAHVHVTDHGVDVNIHGMTVRSGDLVHADRHGAVVIPLEVAREVPATPGRARQQKQAHGGGRDEGQQQAARQKEPQLPRCIAMRPNVRDGAGLDIEPHARNDPQLLVTSVKPSVELGSHAGDGCSLGRPRQTLQEVNS